MSRTGRLEVFLDSEDINICPSWKWNMRCFRVRACMGIILSYSHTSGSWLIGISFDLSGSKKISSQGQSHAHALHAMAFPIDSPKWQMAIFFCDLLAHQLVQKSPCPCRPKNGSAKKSKWESGLIARCHRRIGKDQKTYQSRCFPTVIVC